MEAGGGKFLSTKSMIVDGEEAFDNGGPGLWYDSQNKNAVVRNSSFHDNRETGGGWEGIGLMFEISDGPLTMENCYSGYNDGVELLIAESFGVTATGNTLDGAIEFRDMDDRGAMHVQNVRITNNKLYNFTIYTTLGADDWSKATVTERNIVIDSNQWIGDQPQMKWGNDTHWYQGLDDIRSNLGLCMNDTWTADDPSGVSKFRAGNPFSPLSARAPVRVFDVLGRGIGVLPAIGVGTSQVRAFRSGAYVMRQGNTTRGVCRVNAK